MANDLEIIDKTKYEKSNVLITGKYNMTRLEQKIVAYSLSVIRGRKITEEDKIRGIQVSFPIAEIRKVMSIDSERHSLATELKKVAAKIEGRIITIENEEENGENFLMFPLIKTAKYKDGMFTITYHEEATSLIANLKSNFTILELDAVMGFQYGYTIRMYELIKSQGWLTKNGVYRCKLNIIDLKMMLGLIDENNERVRDAQKVCGDDYDKLEEMLNQIDKGLSSTGRKMKLQVHKYKKWGDFKRYALDLARDELKEFAEKGIVDFYFEYEPIRIGRFIKELELIIYSVGSNSKTSEYEEENVITMVTLEQIREMVESMDSEIFINSVNARHCVTPVKTENGLESDALLTVTMLGFNLFNIGLKQATIYNMFTGAEYDIDRVLRNMAYTYNFMKSGKEVRDVQGFLVTACNSDYAG